MFTCPHFLSTRTQSDSLLVLNNRYKDPSETSGDDLSDLAACSYFSFHFLSLRRHNLYAPHVTLQLVPILSSILLVDSASSSTGDSSQLSSTNFHPDSSTKEGVSMRLDTQDGQKTNTCNNFSYPRFLSKCWLLHFDCDIPP